MNVGKYYVAGIPFDSENSLKHYGVKGMEWNKHKFGIDADDRYIKWLKNAGQNIGRFANNAAQNVAKGATAAAKTVGTAVNKGANFVTGNQDRQNAAAKRSEARTYNQRAANPVRSMGYAGDTKTARPSQWFDKDAGLTGRDYSQQIADQQRVYASKAAKANQEANEYERRANNAVIPTVNRAANAVGNQAGQVAQNAGDWAKGAAQKVADVALWPATREDVANAAKNVGNAVGQAAQNVGNAVGGAANKATEGAKGFLNSAGQWISGATNNVKNTASKAASDAKKGASGFLNSAGQWVSNAAGNVKNAAQNVGNTVGQAAQNVGNTVGQAAQNVGNTVGQAAEQARGGIGGLFDRVGNAVGSAANAVGDWAGNAAKDVGNTVGGAANAVGDWAGQAVQDVGGAVQNAGQAVANVPQNIANWYTGNDAKQKAQQQRELGNLNQQYGNALMDAARDGNWNSEENRLGAWDEGMRNYLEGGGQLRAADQYMDMYNNAPRQRIASGLQNVGNTVGQAAQNVGGAVNAVGDWVGDRVTDARDAITAPARENEWNQLKERNQAIRDENERKFDELGGWGGSGVYAYNPNNGYMLENDLQKSWDQYHNNVRDINQNPVSSAVNYAAGNVADWARNAAGNVGNAVSGAAGNAVDWARNAAGNVGNWIGDRARDAGDYVARQIDPTYNIGERLRNAYIEGINELPPDNIMSPQHNEWIREQVRNDPELRAFYEQYMKHSAISEKPDGVSDAFWEKFTADGGTREEYERDWR